MNKKFIYGLVLATSLVACTEDYKDWAMPQQNAQEAIVSFGNGSVEQVEGIDLASVTDDSVQVCKITAPVFSSSAYAPEYELTLDGNKIDVSKDGKVAAADLQSIIESVYGKRPAERTFKATLSAWASSGASSIKLASSDFEVKATPKAPYIAAGYYLVGDMFSDNTVDPAINGWTEEIAVANKFSHSAKDVYEDPEFSIVVKVTADNQYWKIIPQDYIGVGNIWGSGVVGVAVDGDDALSGTLINSDAKAFKFAKAGKYRVTINMMEYTYKIEEVKFDEYVYFIGATDGWKASDQKLALADDDGTYKGFVYVADPNNWGMCFKFQRVAGSWDNEINYQTFDGGVEGLVADGSNIKAETGAGVYYMEMSLSKNTLKAVKIEKAGLVGDFSGWGNDVEMTWNETDYCYEATNPGVTANGWKFRFNADWAINLGGALDNLTYGGDNISVVGNTIKLYPTRKTNANIFATVE